MDEVYFLVHKTNENRVFCNYLKKDDILFDFNVYQESYENQFVKQITKVDDKQFEINPQKGLLDEAVRVYSRYANVSNDVGIYSLIKSRNNIGEYNNRIFRPLIKDATSPNPMLAFKKNERDFRLFQKECFKKSNFLPIDRMSILSALNQLSLLISNLQVIFQTIHPCNENLNAFGHSIRNLLILACTEVETQFKGILNANGYVSSANYLNTNDYVLLNEILKLDNYLIRFDYYPWLEELSPFLAWEKANPTKSLIWYDNYNQVKHDRETHFKCGSIKNVLNAIAAVAILIRAQYGEQDVYWKEHIGGFFRFVELPKWSIDEKYIPPIEGEDWIPVNYPFSN